MWIIKRETKESEKRRRIMVSTSLVRISITLKRCNEPFTVPIHYTWSTLTTRRIHSRATTLISSTNRRDTTSKITKKKKLPRKNVVDDDVVDEDAFDALFRQLEEDLKNDDINGNDDEDEDVEISEEEMAKLEQELAEALGDDELYAALESIVGGEMGRDADEEENDAIDSGEDEDDHEEDEEEEVMPVKLKSWQIRRLAYALKNGRRKTKIKDLAAELCLDRADVLKLLRDPPPSLVLMSASLPEKPVSPILEPVEEYTETVETLQDNTDQEPEKKLPVHEMQSNWSARKRLKKVQVETLEQVYKRSKRPTNAMISSIVLVTNLPRKRVVKWFEEKRNEDGVPENRVPYQKPVALETVFTS